MFVNIIEFPPVKEATDEEFREWFAWSNKEYAAFDGFIRRRLLRPREGGNYVGLVEHQTYETFMAMHTSPVQAEAAKRVNQLLDGRPTPAFFEVAVDSSSLVETD